MRHRIKGSIMVCCDHCEKESDANYEITPYFPERGECGFSLGQPEEPSEIEWHGDGDCPHCGAQMDLESYEDTVWLIHSERD
jgi:hypothetical protein